MSEYDIADATEGDIEGITAIVNDVIETSTAIFSETPFSVEDRLAWWKGRLGQGYPVLVARERGGKGGVLGYSTFGDFRSWPGYRFTVEHSVHVRADVRGRGIGPALVGALLPRGVAAGKHVMVAGVDAANAVSIRMHERLGFVQVGRMPQVGWKFGRWLDLVFLQIVLGES